MREVSKGHVFLFNNKVRENVTEEDLESFFKVTSTINKLIASKMIFNNIDKKAVHINQ
jgi:hypothetical protein